MVKRIPESPDKEKSNLLDTGRDVRNTSIVRQHSVNEVAGEASPQVTSNETPFKDLDPPLQPGPSGNSKHDDPPQMRPLSPNRTGFSDGPQNANQDKANVPSRCIPSTHMNAQTDPLSLQPGPSGYSKHSQPPTKRPLSLKEAELSISSSDLSQDNDTHMDSQAIKRRKKSNTAEHIGNASAEALQESTVCAEDCHQDANVGAANTQIGNDDLGRLMTLIFSLTVILTQITVVQILSNIIIHQIINNNVLIPVLVEYDGACEGISSEHGHSEESNTSTRVQNPHNNDNSTLLDDTKDPRNPPKKRPLFPIQSGPSINIGNSEQDAANMDSYGAKRRKCEADEGNENAGGNMNGNNDLNGIIHLFFFWIYLQNLLHVSFMLSQLPVRDGRILVAVEEEEGVDEGDIPEGILDDPIINIYGRGGQDDNNEESEEDNHWSY